MRKRDGLIFTSEIVPSKVQGKSTSKPLTFSKQVTFLVSSFNLINLCKNKGMCVYVVPQMS